MKSVLVTGSNGQLGNCIQKVASDYVDMHFVFTDAKTMDITSSESIERLLTTNKFDYCINCAAYTNVEQAEKTPKKAYEVNAKGAKNLALACMKNNVVLIHISTDYVFDGKKETPYTVQDIPNPINQYGKSKLEGENSIKELLEAYFVVRTSWLYSEYGKNFYKTILEKSKTEKTLFITDEQKGCPTNANRLATYVIKLISEESENYGIHHFSDEKVMSWYDFARDILVKNGLEKKVMVQRAKNYITLAKRPRNSAIK